MKICGMDHWFLVSTHVRAHVHTPGMNPQYDNGHPSREATVNLKKALPLPTPSSLSLQTSSPFHSSLSKGKEGLFACRFKERKREQELSNCLKPLGWLWGETLAQAAWEMWRLPNSISWLCQSLLLLKVYKERWQNWVCNAEIYSSKKWNDTNLRESFVSGNKSIKLKIGTIYKRIRKCHSDPNMYSVVKGPSQGCSLVRLVNKGRRMCAVRRPWLCW